MNNVIDKKVLLIVSILLIMYFYFNIQEKKEEIRAKEEIFSSLNKKNASLKENIEKLTEKIQKLEKIIQIMKAKISDITDISIGYANKLETKKVQYEELRKMYDMRIREINSIKMELHRISNSNCQSNNGYSKSNFINNLSLSNLESTNEFLIHTNESLLAENYYLENHCYQDINNNPIIIDKIPTNTNMDEYREKDDHILYDDNYHYHNAKIVTTTDLKPVQYPVQYFEEKWREQ